MIVIMVEVVVAMVAIVIVFIVVEAVQVVVNVEAPEALHVCQKSSEVGLS